MEDWIQDWVRTILIRLAGRRPLAEVLPEWQALRDWPEQVLAHHEVRIGALHAERMAVLMGCCLLASLVVYKLDLLDTWLFVVASAIFLVGTVRFFMALFRPRRHEMLLRRDGVELKHGERSVWCPWALFHVPGAGFIQNNETLRPGLYLPVAADAIPFVELREDGRCLAQGMLVSTPQLRFISSRQAVLGGQYEVLPGELVGLLLELGEKLAKPLPARSAAPPEAHMQEEAARAPLAVTGRNGWITAPLAHLVFPTICCNCGGGIEHFHELEFHPWGSHPGSLKLSVPLCNACLQDLARQERKCGLIGLAVGAGTGVVVALLLQTPFDLVQAAVYLLIVLFLAALGWRIGLRLHEWYLFPLQVRYSSLWHSTKVKLRFRRQGYAAEFLARINGR